MIVIGHILDYSRFAVLNLYIFEVHMHIEGISIKLLDMVTLRSTFSEGACPKDHLEGCGHIVRSSTLHSTLLPGCP